MDIPINASFDWRLNNSAVHGTATVHIPHAWIHQNIETACSHDLPSLLEWEARVDLTIDGLTISTTATDRALLDALATGLHSGRALKKYVANAIQHQLGMLIADLHWKSQVLMRDMCLQCHGIRYNSSLMVFQIKGNKACSSALPNFFWEGVYDERARPAELQAVALAALKAGLTRQYRSKSEQLPNATPTVTVEDVATLTPRIDPRKKFHRHLPEGFIEETEVSPWKTRLEQVWLRWQPQNKTK